jgi:hypothetical protein
LALASSGYTQLAAINYQQLSKYRLSIHVLLLCTWPALIVAFAIFHYRQTNIGPLPHASIYMNCNLVCFRIQTTASACEEPHAARIRGHHREISGEVEKLVSQIIFLLSALSVAQFCRAIQYTIASALLK